MSLQDNIESAPVMDQIPLGLVNHTTDGRLRDNTTIYRQEPSPEVDAAWDALSHEGEYLFNVTAEDLRRSGKDPVHCVAWEAGVDALPASLEVFHLIHCLNMVRKEMFHEYYYPPTPDRNRFEEKARRTHSMHCLYMILQNMMCHVDVDIIATVWTPAPYALDLEGVPTGDFSLNKKCRDFQRVSEWLKNHHVVHGNDKLGDLKKPEDAKIFDEDGYWRR
jgi:Mycotoxin biosynthesis protein UstYa